jgi:hypothetical protein
VQECQARSCCSARTRADATTPSHHSLPCLSPDRLPSPPQLHLLTSRRQVCLEQGIEEWWTYVIFLQSSALPLACSSTCARALRNSAPAPLISGVAPLVTEGVGPVEYWRAERAVVVQKMPAKSDHERCSKRSGEADARATEVLLERARKSVEGNLSDKHDDA